MAKLSIKHGKKDPADTTTESVDVTTAADGQEMAGGQFSDQVLSAEDVETEKLKNAIAQVMAEENAVLPHIEQLSSSVAKESGLGDDESVTSNVDAAVEDVSVDVEPPAKTPSAPDEQAKMSSWFVTFMTMRIPIVGWIYLLYLAFSKKTRNRRNFARAYILCKLLFLVLGLIILLILISTAMNILQDLLDYMEML